MRNVPTGIARNQRCAGILIACALTVLVVGAARPALADDGDIDGCCVCDCTEEATTAGGVPPRPEPGDICFDVSNTFSCDGLCAGEGCRPNFFEPLACSALIGCPQADSRMAPVASPVLLIAIGLALAALGVRATRRSA